MRAGQKLFESTGYSYVKVTVDGEADVLKLPIRSTGIAERMDRLRASEPKPPIVPTHVRADSQVGRQLKLKQNDWVKMYDLTDEGYLREAEAHQTTVVLELINQGLALEFEEVDGTPVTAAARKLEILRELGMSTAQFQQLVSDINELTTLTEGDRLAFFVGS